MEDLYTLIVVLYETEIAEAAAVRSLQLLEDSLYKSGIRVLLVDNTPGRTDEHRAPTVPFDYLALGSNLGLAAAYQIALDRARDAGCSHVILLDQDSTVTAAYVQAVTSNVSKQNPVGIWCPTVWSAGRKISPFNFDAFGMPVYDRHAASARLYGINSFSVMNVKFLLEVGGFDPFYWLDSLDHLMYWKAHNAGWQVKCLPSDEQHELSLLSGNPSPERLKSIAFFEMCFVSECCGPVRFCAALIRTTGRGLRNRFTLRESLWSYFQSILRGAITGFIRRVRS